MAAGGRGCWRVLDVVSAALDVMNGLAELPLLSSKSDGQPRRGSHPQNRLLIYLSATFRAQGQRLGSRPGDEVRQ